MGLITGVTSAVFEINDSFGFGWDFGVGVKGKVKISAVGVGVGSDCCYAQRF